MKYYCAFPKRPDNPGNNSSDGYFVAVREANTDEEFTDAFIDRLLCEFDLKNRMDIQNMCQYYGNGKEVKLREFKGRFVYMYYISSYTSKLHEDMMFRSILVFYGKLKTAKIIDSDAINITFLEAELKRAYKELFPDDRKNRLLNWLLSIYLGDLKEKTISLIEHEATDEKRYGRRRNEYEGRIKIYNEMRKNGCDNDAEIFRHIMMAESPKNKSLRYEKGKKQTWQYDKMMVALRKWKKCI